MPWYWLYMLIVMITTKLSWMVQGLEGMTEGICPNNCNNRGTCGDYGLCTCFNNLAGLPAYRGYDCSMMVCPYGVAWMSEEAVKANDMRPLVECRYVTYLLTYLLIYLLS